MADKVLYLLSKYNPAVIHRSNFLNFKDFSSCLAPLHSERLKLPTIMAFLSAIGVQSFLIHYVVRGSLDITITNLSDPTFCVAVPYRIFKELLHQKMIWTMEMFNEDFKLKR